MPLHRISAAAIAAVISAGLSGGSALAHGYDGRAMAAMVAPDGSRYGGSFSVTVSRSQHSNGTGCLTLTQNSSSGGFATLVFGSQKFPYGTFQIFNQTLVATIEAQGYGQNAGLVFIGSARRGSIGPGVFDDVYGGEAFDEGALAFGTKGSC